VGENLGLIKYRERIVRELAGWPSHEEAQEVKKAVECFNREDEDDRD